MKSAANISIRNSSILAAVTVALLVFGVGGWAATAQLSGAVIGLGTIVVEGNVKQIQHMEGGIVGKILVRDGQRVTAGQVLLSLDDTTTKANLAIISSQVEQLEARRLRLEAERDGRKELAVPDHAHEPGGNSNRHLATEVALFRARQESSNGQKSQLREQIEQIGQESEGYAIRQRAKEDELHWIDQDLGRVRKLSDQGLIQFARLAELQRLRAQLEGERGQLVTEVAKASTRIAETELEILQLDQDRQAEVLTELRDVESKLAELQEQRITAEDQLRRTDLLAPQTGTVHELNVHTIGGVIAPGETVMQIVPLDGKLVIDVKVVPADVDQVQTGQQAALRLSAFNQRTTPEVRGTVTNVAPDLIQNAQTGETWYSVRIDLSLDEEFQSKGLVLIPGMPVEAFIKTNDRTALSFLLKPFEDQLARALREE